MITKHRNLRPGFTLVELLTVIAIIGILAGMVFPAINGAIKKANQANAANNLREISKSHFSIAMSQSPQKVGVDASNAAAWAVDLAQKGGVNQADLYFAGNVARDCEKTTIVGYDLKPLTGNLTSATELAYDIAAGMPSVLRDPTVTALLWTYGFDGTDSWEQDSPWGGEGGHIAFADTSVRWFAKTVDGDDNPQLVDFSSGDSTADIKKATPDALSSKPAGFTIAEHK